MIFFFLSHILHINIPTTTHFEIYTTTATRLVQVSILLLYNFPSHVLFFISLSLSLSLSVGNRCMCKRQYQQKKALTEAADHYKFACLWTSLVLPQHKYSQSDFFFFFIVLFEQKVSKVNLMFLGHYGCLRLHHFIFERAFSKSKPLFLNLKQDLSFYLFIYFGLKKYNNWSIYEKVPKPVWSHRFSVMLVELTVCIVYLIFLSFSILTNNWTELRSGSQLNWPVWFGL